MAAFSNFLSKNGLSSATIESLQSNGYNTMENLKQCHNADVDAFAKRLSLNTLQKLKLKSVLTQLHATEGNKHKIISNEEQNAILDLTNFTTKLQSFIDDVAMEHTDYSTAATTFEQHIDAEFDILMKALTQRKQALKGKFQDILREKKSEFEKRSKTYATQQESVNEMRSHCHQLLNQSIELPQLDERKLQICTMSKQLLDQLHSEQRQQSNLFKTSRGSNSGSSSNSSSKHSVGQPYFEPSQLIHFFDLLSEETRCCIQNIDIIAKSIKHPKLLSLNNSGKNHIIHMRWFIDEKATEQVKIEWIKVHENDADDGGGDDSFERADCNYTLLKNGHMEAPINVHHNGNYVCRISYFNVLLRRNLMSNIKTVSIHCNVLWDVTHSGKDVVFIGNRAKLSTDSWRTLFGREIIVCHKNTHKQPQLKQQPHRKSNIYQYRLKIHHACDKGGGFFIGVVPNNRVQPSMTRSFTRYGGFAINKGGLIFPGGRRYTNVTWRNGDIIDTYLDSDSMTLSFAYNGIQLGVASKSLPLQSYRFALTLLYHDDEVELIELTANKN